MGSVRIDFENLWVGRFDDRSPVEDLVDPLDHVHGQFRVMIDSRELPALGYFGPDDVCLNTWMRELWTTVARLAEGPVGSYEFDEGEQGQPCFRFVRDHDALFVSIADGSGGGKANTEWQKVRTDLVDFRTAVATITNTIRSVLSSAAPEVGARWVDERVDPALLASYERRSLAAMETLLTLGVRSNAVDGLLTGRPIIDLAISDDRHEFVELLAHHRADLEMRDERGLTALHRLARQPHRTRMIGTLIGSGADVSCSDNHGWTALHHAAVYGGEANVRTLLSHGANRNVLTATGLSATDLATRNNHSGTVKALHDG